MVDKTDGNTDNNRPDVGETFDMLGIEYRVTDRNKDDDAIIIATVTPTEPVERPGPRHIIDPPSRDGTIVAPVDVFTTAVPDMVDVLRAATDRMQPDSNPDRIVRQAADDVGVQLPQRELAYVVAEISDRIEEG